jgi:hypothetical protein
VAKKRSAGNAGVTVYTWREFFAPVSLDTSSLWRLRVSIFGCVVVKNLAQMSRPKQKLTAETLKD